jgi:hypothetical protein
MEWNNRWTVLDRTGNDVEISEDENRIDGRRDRLDSEEGTSDAGRGIGELLGRTRAETEREGTVHGHRTDGRNIEAGRGGLKLREWTRVSQ